MTTTDTPTESAPTGDAPRAPSGTGIVSRFRLRARLRARADDEVKRRGYGATGGWREAWRLRKRSAYGIAEHLVLAAVAYIPVLVVKPGIETSDTKTYLYLDPGRFLHQVASMWDPSVALGTTTHEYIGYLFPMGPFYWFFSAVGAPVWVAQRLWLGSILFAAGAGTLLLARTFNLRAPGRTVAALAFMLSPYFLQYAGRISVILLPWAGLPFMIAFAARALRQGGWRYPALFALVVAATSGINASSIIYVGVAPLLWLIFAVVVLREATWAKAGIAVLKMAVLTALACLWWIVGLVVEAGYGVDVLRYTETLPATSETSSAAEVIRGLGYWYFYGGDRLGPWTQSAVMYTQQTWLLAVSYLVPVLAFISAVFVRWRERAYFVLLIVVGMVLSVGAYPYTNPTAVGGALKQFMSHTTAGLALRSTDRATPLVVLGLAVLLGAGISAVRIRTPLISAAVALLATAAIVADNPALFNGDAEVASFFTQPAKLPGYELAAMNHLNATHPGTRVLAIPGNDFASYRWGDTVDTPQPAFLNRPFVTREQQIMGSIATADTLFATDDPIQSGTEQWDSLAPMARLMSAGDVLVEYDQRYEHYGVPNPLVLSSELAQTPAGLSDPVAFGSPRPNISSYPDIDGRLLSLSPAQSNSWPSPLVDYTVNDPRPLTRAESDAGSVVVAGDATALEEMAGLGMLDTDSAIYYSGTLDRDPTQLRQLLANGASLVVTDTNRKRAFRWDTITANYGFTETPSQDPAATDPSDYPIELFPGAPGDAKTTASYVGALDVTASSYGNPVSNTPESSAYSAVDDNVDTSWNTGTLMPNPSGQWWQAKFAQPVQADQVTLVQPQTGDLARWITKVTLSFDGVHSQTVDLGPSSRTSAGQVVSFPSRSFETMRITIDSTSNDHMSPTSATGVGFAEVQIPGVHVTQVVQMPSDLLDAAGSSSLGNRLTIAMSRERVSGYSEPVRSDPETTISREFYLPTARTFAISGSASVSTLIPDDEIDRLVGRPTSSNGGVEAYSKGRLPGDVAATASAAADGDPATAWQPGFGSAYQQGDWLEYDLPQPVTFGNLALEVVADGRHSVPTSITVSTENGSRSVQLPRVTDRPGAGSVVTVPVSFPPLKGRDVRITVTGVRLENTTNYYSPTQVALPLGIAEVGIPGVHAAALPPELPGTCESNLITIDSTPVSVRLIGSTASALADGEVSLVPCGADAAGISLGPGNHVVQSALGHSTTTGWNVDQLTLDSAAGGAPEQAVTASPTALRAAQPGSAPNVTTVQKSDTGEQLQVSGASGPFELVLGESSDTGWTATASSGGSGKTVNLGKPQLVDGFANGWQVTNNELRELGASPASTFTVSLRWAPQSWVWVALVISAAALFMCVLLAVVGRRQRLWLVRRIGWLGRGARRGLRTLHLEQLFRRLLKRPRHAGRRRFWPKVRSREAVVESAAADSEPLESEPVESEPVESEPVESEPVESEPVESEPLAPVLASPINAAGRRTRVWVIAVVSVLTALVAGAITTPVAGAAAFAVTVGALFFRRVRTVATLAAVGFMVAAGASVISGQVLHSFPESSNWPAAFRTAGWLTWFAVVSLGVDAVVTSARRSRPKRVSGRS